MYIMHLILRFIVHVRLHSLQSRSLLVLASCSKLFVSRVAALFKHAGPLATTAVVDENCR